CHEQVFPSQGTMRWSREIKGEHVHTSRSKKSRVLIRTNDYGLRSHHHDCSHRRGETEAGREKIFSQHARSSWLTAEKACSRRPRRRSGNAVVLSSSDQPPKSFSPRNARRDHHCSNGAIVMTLRIFQVLIAATITGLFIPEALAQHDPGVRGG